MSFRGSTGTEGSISLVDGIPIIGLFEEVQLNEIPYDAVERTEYVKGPVSALYGRGALYGATNYITRRPDENSSRAHLIAGSDGYYRADLSVERAFESGGLLVAGTFETTKAGESRASDAFSICLERRALTFTERVTLSTFLNLNDRDTDLPNGRPLDAEGQILPFAGGDEGFIGFGRPNNDTNNLLIASTIEYRITDEITATLKGSYRNIERKTFLNFFDPFGRNLEEGIVGYNGFRDTTSQEVFYGEATVRWKHDWLDVIAGATLEQSDTEAFNRWTGQNGFTEECGFTFYLVEVDSQTGEVLNGDNPCFVSDDPLTRNAFDNTFWGAFAQAEIKLLEPLRLTVGLRYDSFSRNATFFPIEGITEGGRQSGSADAFSPKATLSYLTTWGMFYVAYGRGFNSNFGATFEWDPVQYARPETRPTTIDSVEVGAKLQFFDRRLTGEIIGFYSEQRNRRQIVNNPAAEGDFSQPANLITFGDVYESKGLELSITASPTPWTTIRLNYTYLDPIWRDFTIDTFSGPEDFSDNTPVGVPNHILYIQADQRLSDWLSLRGILEYYGEYFYTVNNEFQDGSYVLATFSAQIEGLLEGIVVDLTLMNAFDERYYFYFGNRTSPTYAVPGPPLQFRAAITGTL